MYLNCHSTFSLRYGTLSEEELLALAEHYDLDCIALTDINNTSAGLNFVRKAKEKNIKPVLGIDFRNGIEQCYVALAKNNEGYLELNNFLAQHLHKKIDFPEIAPAFENAFTIYAFERALELDKTHFTENEFIGIGIHDLNKLRFSQYSTYHDKLVLLLPVSFNSKKDFNAHRLLRAIDLNCLLSKLPARQDYPPGLIQYLQHPLIHCIHHEIQSKHQDQYQIAEHPLANQSTQDPGGLQMPGKKPFLSDT